MDSGRVRVGINLKSRLKELKIAKFGLLKAPLFWSIALQRVKSFIWCIKAIELCEKFLQ